jgi:hypothetical protein
MGNGTFPGVVMSRAELAFGLALACLIGGAGSVDAQTADLSGLVGEWHGEMQCNDRRAPLTFNIYPDGMVIVRFEAPEGRPNFRGTFRTAARYYTNSLRH